MKILQVISSFPPAYSYGGAARVAYGISKELVEKGHKVTVYTTDVYDANSRLKYNQNPMYMDGVEVHHFKNVSNKLAHKNYSIAPTMALELKNKIEDFDVIHLHEYRTAQAVIVQHFSKKHNVPYVLQAHGSVMPLFSKQKLKELFDLGWGYRILKNASKIISLTKIEAEQYQKLGVDQNKIEIMPNGINLSEYENLPNRGVFRNKYGIKNDEKIVLYLARIHQIKGGNLLVEAFSDLITRMEKVKLVIAGPDDGFLPTLKKQVEDLKIGDRVLFTGPLYEMDKLEAYIDADVYVLPSVYEAFPVTVLEVCACGTPVIVTDRCGISDIVEKIGYVVKYNKEQLKEAIIVSLSDVELRTRIEQKSKKLIEEQFTWNTITENLEKIYDSIRNNP